MKYLVFVISIMSSVVSAETLTTDNFIIQIERGCEEGEVTCDKVRFIYSPVGFDKKQTVFGKTVHTTCADGIAPCAFQGYEFIADGAKYFLFTIRACWKFQIVKVTNCWRSKESGSTKST
ncbi:MAG: hypothetical protein IPG06_04435 [Haliea sp.]|nr:hypothetical protein [Haliea sp.]